MNYLININPFVGFYDTSPYEALVDFASDLFIPGLEFSTLAPAESCINDTPSTGFAPTGVQPNGPLLTPVAYHGTVAEGFDLAAVSATFRSPTFAVPEPGTLTLILLGLAGPGARRRLVQQRIGARAERPRLVQGFCARRTMPGPGCRTSIGPSTSPATGGSPACTS